MTGLDITVAFGLSGRGLTSTVPHYMDGPVGRARQTLTVRPIDRSAQWSRHATRRDLA